MPRSAIFEIQFKPPLNSHYETARTANRTWLHQKYAPSTFGMGCSIQAFLVVSKKLFLVLRLTIFLLWKQIWTCTLEIWRDFYSKSINLRDVGDFIRDGHAPVLGNALSWRHETPHVDMSRIKYSGVSAKNSLLLYEDHWRPQQADWVSPKSK